MLKSHRSLFSQHLVKPVQILGRSNDNRGCCFVGPVVFPMRHQAGRSANMILMADMIQPTTALSLPQESSPQPAPVPPSTQVANEPIKCD
jgi:hypothetical protein